MVRENIDTGSRLKFYFPDARVLTSQEIAALPREKKNAVEASGKPGVWMEVSCPKEVCITDQGQVTLSTIGAGAPRKKGVFLNLFCPEDSCELTQPTDLP